MEGRIKNCLIISNSAQAGYACGLNDGYGLNARGGGVYCSNGIIQDCIIEANSAKGGKAYSPPMPPFMFIALHGGNGYGGGIYCAGGVVAGCIIKFGTASGGSGVKGGGSGLDMAAGFIVKSLRLSAIALLNRIRLMKLGVLGVVTFSTVLSAIIRLLGSAVGPVTAN